MDSRQDSNIPTADSGEAPQGFQGQKNDVWLEPLSQGGLTLHWDGLKITLAESLDGDMVEVAASQHALRSGRLGAWAIWIPDGDSHKVAGYAITSILNHGFSGSLALSIHALWGREVKEKHWLEALGHLKAICREQNINKIIAITQHQHVVKLSKSVGFKAINMLVLEA